jgi:ADP-heptose:LPS heptosyltransferase
MSRVLLVRLSALGDVVQCLGAVRALAAAAPQHELCFVTQRPFAPLLENLPYLRAVLAHDRRPAWWGMWRTRQRLRREAFDVALDLQGNWKSAAVCFASGAPLRIGAAARREPASRWLLHRTAPGDDAHPARTALAVVRALAPAAEDLLPRLAATPGEIEREAAAVRAAGIDPERPFRVLVWTAPDDPRSWPLAAMQREAADGPPVLWLAGPDEAAQALPVRPLLRHGAGELRRLVALGHVAAAARAVALGPDRGAMHVLAACGVECRLFFGPQDPRRTGPVGVTALVRADAPDCAPCRKRRCAHPHGPVCMDFTSAGARQFRVPGVDGPSPNGARPSKS